MYAVEKLGSYITRGVYTVSGPFHPFGGAVDIIVVQQQDGSYKSSPWYVRFGKFQGVLKAKEKVVRIGVNDNDAGFHMYLDNKGEAYFLIDAEATDGESVVLSPPTSGDEMVVKIESPRFKKAKSCREPIEQVDAGDGKMVEQKYSKRSGLLGLMFGRRSMKENGINQNGQLTTSMERAEFAADLLETNWSTNLSAKNSKTGSSVGVDVAVKEGGLEMPASTSNNVSSSTLTSSHFEELIVEDSPSRGDDEEVLSSNTSTELIDMTKDQITLGADDSDVTLNNSGHRKPISGYTTPFFNCDGSLEESVDDNDEKPGDSLVSGKMYENSRKEKPCVRSQEEVMELTPLETVSSTGRSEMIFELSLSESDGFHVPSEGPSSSSGSSGGQSPTLAAASCDSDNSTKESHGASFFHGSKAGNGETEVMPVSYCQAAESRNTRFHASTIEAEEVLHLSPGSDEKSERHYEVLYGRSELILEVKSEPENDACRENLDGGQHQNLEVSAVDFYSLSESPQVDQPVDRSLDTKNFHESPQTDGVSPNLSGSHSSLQGNLIHYESEVMYQDKGNVKSDQDKETNTEQAEVLVNQIGSSELGVVETSESVQPPHSFGNSESHNTWGFSNSLSSSDHVEEGVDVDEALKPESSWLSDEVEIAQEAVDPTSMGAVKGRAPSSDILEEDQFLFSDIENSEAEGIGHEQSQKDTTDEMDDHHSHIVLADREEGMKDTNDDHSSGKLSKAPRTRTRPLNIPRPRPQLDETKLSVRSLPIIYSRVHDFEGSNLLHPLSCSLNLSSEKDAQVSLESQISSPSKLEANSESSVNIYISKYADTAVDSEKWAEQNNASTHPSFGMVGVDQAGHNLAEDASVPMVPSGGSWNLWPFSRKPKTAITVCSSTETIVVKDVETASTLSRSPRRNNDTEEDQTAKKKVRSLTPTSEELASLNLNEGSNTITFTFSTAMLGAQQVDARIYLWKWNTRVVISDVDGTITKSDVLGQFMPLVGKDWSHTGVTHLFSAIKENGYQLLFLSARSISQAYITRQFLFNLKQDGKALPDGPVVISPDGLFPSLYREVIRRAPHEFKISTLEVIKALFPPDCNPFYAGFGNRDTDEISYLKVGIPKGKIFIINPKGEVAVNRQIDTKSYPSLHALVNGIFPPMSSAEQEDYNSWNYWKLPPIFDVDT